MEGVPHVYRFVCQAALEGLGGSLTALFRTTHCSTSERCTSWFHCRYKNSGRSAEKECRHYQGRQALPGSIWSENAKNVTRTPCLGRCEMVRDYLQTEVGLNSEQLARTGWREVSYVCSKQHKHWLKTSWHLLTCILEDTLRIFETWFEFRIQAEKDNCRLPRSSGGVLGRDFEREGLDANGEQFTLPCRVLVVSQDMAGLQDP